MTVTMAPGLLEVGDYLPGLRLTRPDVRHKEVMRAVVGRPMVLLLYGDRGDPGTEAVLRGFADRNPELSAHAAVVAVSRQSADAEQALAERSALPFPVFSDSDGAATQVFGVTASAIGGPAMVTAIVSDGNRRIMRIDRDVTDPGHAEALLSFFAGQPKREAREIVPAAPVLAVPRVFSPAFCQRLIALHETGYTAPSGVRREGETAPEGIIDPTTKSRRDLIVTDQATVKEIGRQLGKRVVPEIMKAFSFAVGFAQEFKVGCYGADDRGFFKPHRDNSGSLTGRRFAMSLNLNSGEYEGGHLRFPEFGPELYRPAAGDAIVFSCGLLHEALPVTAGRRFTLLTFFHGKEEQQTAVA